MKCPICSWHDDRVLDTRISKDGNIIRRRRACLQCQARFSTQEALIQELPEVVKRDGHHEPFSKTKISAGLQAACLKRPISLPLIDRMVESVTQKVMELGVRSISSMAIGKLVLSELKTVDDVAFVRFASVYQDFRDLNEFIRLMVDLAHPVGISVTEPGMEA
ncbi:MAG: transcriptional regulator NrdR [Bdellovibrionales bacterium]|nr:transcriptional regulator NrdR [Bdellovibrionales bacterium]